MSSTDGQGSDASRVSIVTDVDLEFEAVVIPVSDVDRAKEFYRDLGWRLDADFAFDNGFRVVQFTPPGSGSSVQFGTNITTAAPRLGPGPVPGGLRHRGGARSAGCPRCADQRCVPSRDAGCSVPAGRDERSRRRGLA